MPTTQNLTKIPVRNPIATLALLVKVRINLQKIRKAQHPILKMKTHPPNLQAEFVSRLIDQKLLRNHLVRLDLEVQLRVQRHRYLLVLEHLLYQSILLNDLRARQVPKLLINLPLPEVVRAHR